MTPPERVTAHASAHEQLLYFTSPSLLADDRRLVFLSDRDDGHPNLYVRDLVSGQELRLSDNRDGVLKSYVYFDGTPYRGLGKASVSVHAATGRVFYIQGTELIVTDAASGARRVLAELPRGQMTAFTHVSADGAKICVPTTEARALDGDAILPGKPAYDIDARVQAENLSSYLRIYDTATGRELACEPVPRAWITHVQFCPADSSLLAYNHEWPADCGIRRLWLWDGRTHRALRTEGAGRSRRDWTCHEMWERDGRALLYHGAYADTGLAYLGRVALDGSDPVEIALPAGWKRYGHFTEGPPGVLVSDGYYETDTDGEPHRYGAWISLLRVDWSARTIAWQPLCRNGSSWDSQDSHPHPVFNHAADAVYFTSDRTGRRAVYRVPISPDVYQARPTSPAAP